MCISDIRCNLFKGRPEPLEKNQIYFAIETEDRFSKPVRWFKKHIRFVFPVNLFLAGPADTAQVPTAVSGAESAQFSVPDL